MKKLYGDFNKEDWLRVSGMTAADVPETIILHGEDGNISENIAEWEPAFESVLSRPRWNMFVGKRNDKLIGFANVIWAPMAALVIHKFARMGTKCRVPFFRTGQIPLDWTTQNNVYLD